VRTHFKFGTFAAMKIALPLSLICLLLCVNIYAQELKYVVGQNQWAGDSLGNHRAVVQVSQASEVAKATIDWRRRDKHTDGEIIVVDAKANKRILNVKTENISRESGDVFFEPLSGTGQYYIYYLPYKVNGRANYPTATYLKKTETASAAWKSLSAKAVAANVLYIESINELNSFYPMEVIAKASEVSKLIADNASKSYLVFPEDRMHPIKMTDDLPQRWILKGALPEFKAEVSPGENFTFQLGVYPVKTDLKNIKIRFSDLKNGKNTLPANAFSCLNTDGTSWDGKPLKNQVNVRQRKNTGIMVPYRHSGKHSSRNLHRYYLRDCRRSCGNSCHIDIHGQCE
jgi:hypothetical protein